MNILIVDDEALARSRLRTLLSDLNAAAASASHTPGAAQHSMTEAANAAEALA